MNRPPLDTPQMEAALNAYYANREQAGRYYLAQLDPAAFDAPARPYLDVLLRIQELLVGEIAQYTPAPEPEPGAEAAPDEPGAAPATPQEPGV